MSHPTATASALLTTSFLTAFASSAFALCTLTACPIVGDPDPSSTTEETATATTAATTSDTDVATVTTADPTTTTSDIDPDTTSSTTDTESSTATGDSESSTGDPFECVVRDTQCPEATRYVSLCDAIAQLSLAYGIGDPYFGFLVGECMDQVPTCEVCRDLLEICIEHGENCPPDLEAKCACIGEFHNHPF